MQSRIKIKKSGEVYTLPTFRDGDADSFAEVGEIEIKFMTSKQDGTRLVDVLAMCLDQAEATDNAAVIDNLRKALIASQNT
jgi:hypothetical protein